MTAVQAFLEKNKERILPLAVAFGHFLFTFIGDVLIYQTQGAGEIPYRTPLYLAAKCIVLVLLIAGWRAVFSGIDFRKLRYGLPYFLIMMALLLVMWPGIWRFDEMQVINWVTNGYVFYWQHWLSSLYFLVCLELIPIAGGILILQNLLIAMIVGHILNRMEGIIGRKWCIAAFVFLLLPAAVDNNLYPIRSSVAAYLELYVLFTITFAICTGEQLSFKSIAALAAATGVAAAWRPENLVYVVLIPLILLVVRKADLRKMLLFLLVTFLLFAGISRVQNQGLEHGQTEHGYRDKERYTLSGIMWPLGELIKTDFRSDDPEGDIEIIDRVLSVEMIRESNAHDAYWYGGLGEITEENLAAVEKVYVKLILYNLPSFIRERITFFFRTNGFGEKPDMFTMYSAHVFDPDYTELEQINPEAAEFYSSFKQRYSLVRPPSITIRRLLVSTLEGKRVTDYAESSLGGLWLFYDVVPILVLLLVLAVSQAFRKKWTPLLLVLPVFAKTGLVIATAPWTSFMYYFSAYLSGGLLALFLLARVLQAKHEKAAAIPAGDGSDPAEAAG
ncbi:MAG: hypothetical protein IJI62_09015 [Lachnospiraceae bacterium]|nr:hypothetical protein [Lachnospiraceae bacterium]